MVYNETLVSLFEEVVEMMHSQIFYDSKVQCIQVAKTKRKFYDPTINQRHLLPQKKYTNMIYIIKSKKDRFPTLLVNLP